MGKTEHPGVIDEFSFGDTENLRGLLAAVF
jgi:hypothetical protein